MQRQPARKAGQVIVPGPFTWKSVNIGKSIKEKFEPYHPEIAAIETCVFACSATEHGGRHG